MESGFFEKKTAIFIMELLLIFYSLLTAKEDSNYSQLSSNKKILLLPILNFSVSYHDNTRLKPEKFVSDSMLNAFANELCLFSARKKFKTVIWSSVEVDTSLKIYFKSDSATGNGEKDFGNMVKNMAEEQNCDLVMVIPVFKLNKYAVKPQGWRDAQPYEKPVKNFCTGEAYIQFWDKSGNLIIEEKRSVYFRKPFMKKLFIKKGIDSDLLSYSKKIYAPPMLKCVVKLVNNPKFLSESE